MRSRRFVVAFLAVTIGIEACVRSPFRTPAPPTRSASELMRQVEVRRTTHGVPHIFAQNLAAAAYAEAYGPALEF